MSQVVLALSVVSVLVNANSKMRLEFIFGGVHFWRELFFEQFLGSSLGFDGELLCCFWVVAWVSMVRRSAAPGVFRW